MARAGENCFQLSGGTGRSLAVAARAEWVWVEVMSGDPFTSFTREGREHDVRASRIGNCPTAGETVADYAVFYHRDPEQLVSSQHSGGWLPLSVRTTDGI